MFATIKYQTVILSDFPNFGNRFYASSKWIIILSLLTGYFAYLLPAAGLAGFLFLIESESILCSPMEATFLFNNSATLSLNTTFTDLYRDRKRHGGMVSDMRYMFDEGCKRLEMPFNNLTDFVSQFNYAGYHDICNYPERNELFRYYYETDTSKNPKGFSYNYPGYIWKNSSGMSCI
mgnify:CR=1 FL=1